MPVDGLAGSAGVDRISIIAEKVSFTTGSVDVFVRSVVVSEGLCARAVQSLPGSTSSGAGASLGARPSAYRGPALMRREYVSLIYNETRGQSL